MIRKTYIHTFARLINESVYLFIGLNLSCVSLLSALLDMSWIYNLHRLLVRKSKESEKPPDA